MKYAYDMLVRQDLTVCAGAMDVGVHPAACLGRLYTVVKYLDSNNGDRHHGAPLGTMHSPGPCQQLLSTCHSPVAQ